MSGVHIGTEPRYRVVDLTSVWALVHFLLNLNLII
jgi:hypothetical protein